MKAPHHFSPILPILGLLLLASSITGCWTAALQIAPVALEATGAIASSAADWHSNAAAARAGEKGYDDADRQERCEDLRAAAPKVVELRQAAAGNAPDWRELQLDNSTGNPGWVPSAASSETSAWQPATHLSSMQFDPPLASQLKPGVANYLVFSAAEPQTPAETDELVGFTAEFGAGTGTFQWNERSYQYALVTQLPCQRGAVAAR